jgi:hypothetical protein
MGTALWGQPHSFLRTLGQNSVKKEQNKKHLPVDKMRPSILFIGKCFVFYWLIYFFKERRGKGYEFL